jgi:hypothetical protein
VNPSSFTVVPGGSREITLTYAPLAVGTLGAALTIRSNDPDAPSQLLAVTATADHAPQLTSSHASMGARLIENSVETQLLRLGNSTLDGAQLDFAIVPTVFDPPAPGKPAGTPDASTPARPSTEGSGGPDPFGYTWKDSDQPDGPAFAWIDINGSGTPISFLSDEANYGPFPIGFSFPFYGQLFSSVRVCTNGWLSFTNSGTTFTNTALPNGDPATPENLIAPLWDDLNFANPTYNPDPFPPRGYTHTDGERFVVSFVRVKHSGKDGAGPARGPYTFQVILHPSGKIAYQSLDVEAPTNSCTIGIQDATRSLGLQVLHNGAYLHDSLAVQIQKTPDWLSAAPANGVVPAAGFADVTVTFNSAGLAPGTYAGRLRVSSNDASRGTQDIPVTLQVITPTDAVVRPPRSDAFEVSGTNPVHGVTRFSLTLPRRAWVEIGLYDVRGALVRELVHQLREPGGHSFEWDGRDARSRAAAAGVYFLRLRTADFERTLRVTKLR